MRLTTMNTTTITMTSRQIAELLDCRHDKVKQSIERLANRGVIGLPPLGEYRDSLGRPAAEYRIEKRDSYVIVAQPPLSSPPSSLTAGRSWRHR